MTTTVPMAADAANPVETASPPVPAGAVDTPSAVPAGTPDANFALIVGAARDPTIDPEKLAKLIALQERIEDRAAQRAFNAALALAKAEFPPILKTHLVDYAHKDDRGRTSYKHEELADITTIVDPILGKHGLSARFKQRQEKDRVGVSCVLSHADGHSEEGEVLWAIEDRSGQKNPIQAVTSTITYLQRATLKVALGLAAGRDSDGRNADAGPPFAMSADDILYVETLIRDTDSDLPKFLETIGAPTIPDFNGDQYKRAISLLNEKKRRAASGAKK